MRVTSIKTIRPIPFPNLLYVHVHTDEGITGLGETFLGVGPVEAHFHEIIAPYLLGKDPSKISIHHELLRGFLGIGGSGNKIYLKDIWPTSKEITNTLNSSLNSNMFKEQYSNVYLGTDKWRELESTDQDLFSWD